MAYTAEISRANPSAFVFLIDQSGSMMEPIAGSAEGKRKCDSVSDAINRLLHNLIIKCARGEGVRNFYDVGVIGYGAEVVTGARQHFSRSFANCWTCGSVLWRNRSNAGEFTGFLKSDDDNTRLSTV